HLAAHAARQRYHAIRRLHANLFVLNVAVCSDLLLNLVGDLRIIRRAVTSHANSQGNQQDGQETEFRLHHRSLLLKLNMTGGSPALRCKAAALVSCGNTLISCGCGNSRTPVPAPLHVFNMTSAHPCDTRERFFLWPST